ncbi:Ras- protein Rab-3A [Crenichthys baileyi]|uniref:Ras-related protein Rab-3 n=1 Tax=Crenichthys baileyi TaxID=28760 RepID=A0AAV9RVP3_9TELE
MASANATYGQKESSDQNFDYMFKILIIGNSSVGKTSFLFRYADDSFTPAFVSTVGIDFKVKTIYRNDKRIKLQIWDTAGQERYRTITTAYYRGAMGFILMYDITNEESFNAVQDWSTQIKTYSWDNAQVLLVGNKCDMEDERVVASERGRQLSEQLGFEFFEASAKDNINVKQTFERLVDIICERMTETLDNNDPTVIGAKQGPQLNEQPQRSHQDYGNAHGTFILTEERKGVRLVELRAVQAPPAAVPNSLQIGMFEGSDRSTHGLKHLNFVVRRKFEKLSLLQSISMNAAYSLVNEAPVILFSVTWWGFFKEFWTQV